MPSIYSTPDAFTGTAIGSAFAAQIAALDPSAVAYALVTASETADSYCRRKLGTPPSTTIAATVSSGSPTIAVASVANVHETDICVLPDGTALEVLGADITDFAPPFAGTVTLSASTPESYSTGQSVTFYRQDQQFMRGKKTDPLDQDVAMTQAGQIALAHSPAMGFGAFARRVMTNEYPLWSIHAAYQTLPWTGTESEIAVDLSNIVVNRAGYFQLPVGFPNFLGSTWRVQYSAGFAVIPYDLRDAVHLYLAEELARMQNPMGANEIRIDSQMVRTTRPSSPAGAPTPTSQHIELAERKLARYRRKA